MDKILVAYDGSEKSHEALKYAFEIAESRKDNPKITAVYVEKGGNKRLKSLLEDYGLDGETEDVLESLGSKENGILEKGKNLVEDKNVEFEFISLDQEIDPATDIVNFANKNNFSHIIVGSRGRSGISRIALGSVAEEIVRRSASKVTVVR